MKNIFGQTLLKFAEQDSKLVLLTCDVLFPGADEFKSKYPDRFYNFGLTEQTTVGIAAGMASQGLHPVVYTISPFLLERCFEFIKVDIDVNNLSVVLVGYDYGTYYGETHSCADAKKMVSIFRNVLGYFPSTEIQARHYLEQALNFDFPSFTLLKKSE